MLGVPIFAMVPNDYPELYEAYAEGRMLTRTSELGKHIAKLATKLGGLEEESTKKRFALFG
jgi:Flp pilus assembly CpaE family ATPase